MKKEQSASELFDQALSDFKSGKSLEGKEGALVPLLKRLLEASMEDELDHHLNESRPNRRNGKGKKNVKTGYGELEIDTVRDREGTFEPELVPKQKRRLGAGLEQKIINLYGLGMSYQDISNHLVEIYGTELSKGQLSAITDRIWPEIEEWRARPLDDIYPFVWMDALYYKVRQDGQIKKMVAYLVLGMNAEGEKDLLGIYLSENESASFWLQVLNDIKERGAEDILIACIDNLNGFKEAIEAMYPQTDVQLCIVHQVRNSIRYVPWKNQREVIQDMKNIYRAIDLYAGEQQLEAFEHKWKEKYPAIIKSWKHNW